MAYKETLKHFFIKNLAGSGVCQLQSVKQKKVDIQF